MYLLWTNRKDVRQINNAFSLIIYLALFQIVSMTLFAKDSRVVEILFSL